LSQKSFIRADRMTPGMFVRLFGNVVRVLSAKLHGDGTVLCKHDSGDGPLAKAEPRSSVRLDAGECFELVAAQCRRAA